MRGVEHVYPFFRLLIVSFALIGVSPAWAETRAGFDVDVTVSGVEVAAANFDSAASTVDEAIPDIDLAGDDIDMAAEDEDGANDPIESVNRFIFGFNEIFYTILLRPISKAYNYLPQPIREAVSNVLDNVSSPKVLANDVLQGAPTSRPGIGKTSWASPKNRKVPAVLQAGCIDIPPSSVCQSEAKRKGRRVVRPA